MKIIEKIDNTSRILEKTSRDKDDAYKKLQLIQNRIKNRKMIIENIQKSLALSNEQIESGRSKQNELLSRFIELRKDHNILSRLNYLKMLTQNKMVYFLSSDNWEQTIQRLRYSRKIEDHLQKQMSSLNMTRNELNEALSLIEEEQSEQKSLLKEVENNIDQLEKDEEVKDELVLQLQGDEKRFRGALISQKKDREELNKAIEHIILSSFRKDGNTDVGALENKDAIAIGNTDKFELKGNRLDWPVDHGSIISKYGKQKHPSLKNIYIQNNGVDIQSYFNAAVRAVFKGEVAGSMQIPGNDFMIIIKHGDYYSVYSKMDEIFVKKGDLVKTGERIGRLGRDNGTLHFEIWHEKQKVDPENWLK